MRESNRGALFLSTLIIVLFGGMLLLVLTRVIPAESQSLANVLLGTLAAMAGQVANFWLGSSSGSARKDDVIAAAMPGEMARALLPPNATVTPTPEAAAKA